MPSTHTHSNGALLKSDKAAPTLPPLTLWQHLGHTGSHTQESHNNIKLRERGIDREVEDRDGETEIERQKGKETDRQTDK